MKITDDHDAKLKLWAAEHRVPYLPRAAGLPRLASQKFDSYEVFNVWKRQYLDDIARNGGLKWTK